MDEVEVSVRMPAVGVVLEADVAVPEGATGVVLFAHGSGSGRHSPRNRFVARELRRAGLATVLADLLTAEEERVDARTGHLRFDIALLAARVGAVADLLPRDELTRGLAIGLFGASTGAAAALVAAATRPDTVRAVVSRGGRPDLAEERLRAVTQPTLLIVGERDPIVADLNREAMGGLGGRAALEIVPHASHLFEEPGALEEVARLATGWFLRHLAPPAAG
ncbi:dienelactone hydrolase family protein [Microbispora sp. ATCC PTA-5024]|uniref:dienelactone hydrolase family protein n=1 Tax=Microbispora sp. ATCC PTA-5024 TaxID=316330 RepID=UPI0003DDE990|nr:alpha/beta family hydrolase [Microbispora sp. ATCC PTA-5024]ETK30510.1 DeoR family transcriptional regulator [Microbispora sp. ATCC PTA-5024]